MSDVRLSWRPAGWRTEDTKTLHDEVVDATHRVMEESGRAAQAQARVDNAAQAFMDGEFETLVSVARHRRTP